ncbi:MAG: HAD family phosphatase [Ruminococcaceae bacterium]|nr:HAD family phosphatase [Oscillospiraceae bacterium]
MPTLYLTDLDGTLLTGSQRVSERTCEILNRLTADGLRFSFATARSRFSSRRAVDGLEPRLPMIVYNGTFIQDITSGQVLHGNYLDHEKASDIIDWYIRRGIFPIVYSLVDGREHFSYVPERSCRALLDFVATREGDPRLRATDIDGLYDGDIFYITAMGDDQVLTEGSELFSADSTLNCLLYPETYTGDLWLEIMPAAASKAVAALKLKGLLGCDRLVCFGDGVNDIPMFQAADECYAVANAAPELKAMATDIIGSNEEDAVALWLEQNAEY